MNRTDFKCLVLWIICFIGVCHIRYLQNNEIETKEVTIDVREQHMQAMDNSKNQVKLETSNSKTY